MPSFELDEFDELEDESSDDYYLQSIKEASLAGLIFLRDTVFGTLKFAGTQVKAMPSFFRTVQQNPKAMAVIKDTGRIALDAGAIVGVTAVNQMLQKSIEEAASDEGAMLPGLLLMTGAVINACVWAWKLRQKMKVALRSAVLMSQHSGVFNKATKDTDIRKAFKKEVCDDCTKMRYYKGEFKDFILYYAQQFLIDHFLRQIPYLGNPSATFLTFLLRGQLILSYRLANEGICERHRAVYFREYLELCFSMGLSVEMTAHLLAMAAETVTGVPKEEYEYVIKNLISVYFIGLSHQMDIPAPLPLSQRKLNPLAYTHLVTSEVLEVQMAGIQARAPVWAEMLKSDEPTIDFLKLINQAITIYRDPRTESIMVFFVPDMMLGLKPFFHDSVVAHHWEPIQGSLVDTLDLIEAYVDEYTKTTMKGKVLSVLNQIEINGSTLTSKVVKSYFNISEDMTKKLVAFFTSEEYREWSQHIRQELVLTRPIRKDKLDAYNTDALRAAIKPRGRGDHTVLKALSYENKGSSVIPHPLQIEVEKELDVAISEVVVPDFPTAKKETKLTDKIENMIKQTQVGLTLYQQSRWAANDKGEKRRDVYLSLLRNFEKDPVLKCLICYAFFANKEGPTLHDKVRNTIFHSNPTSQRDKLALDRKLNASVAEIKTELGNLGYDVYQRDCSEMIKRINGLANEAHKDTMPKLIALLTTQIKELSTALTSTEPSEEDRTFAYA